MSKGRLIHAAMYLDKHNGKKYLLLRETAPHCYTWFVDCDANEVETEVSAPSIAEALRKARRAWKFKSFQTVACGFRYTLPERDEHGINALFHQMAASYKTPNGVYFDEELGHNCFVQAASAEALDLWKRLESANRL